MSALGIVLQTRQGALHPMAREAIAAGQALAAASGRQAFAILIGQDVEAASAEAAACALSEIVLVRHESLADYTPTGYAAAIAAALEAQPASWLLFPHSYQSVDYMGRVAHALGAGVLPEIVGFRAEGEQLVFRRPILEGKMQAEVQIRGDGPMVLSVQSGAFSAESIEGGSAPVQAVELAGVAQERELLGVEEVGGDAVDLSAAERIVAVGRGIGGADKMEVIEKLAAALGAEIGASRPVIDSGWLPRDRQIGSSGQTVAPKLYLAVGISGAIQHLVGMKGSSCVVAVNKDPGAPIFGVADYGIVGDLFEVVPALVSALEERAR